MIKKSIGGIMKKLFYFIPFVIFLGLYVYLYTFGVEITLAPVIVTLLYLTAAILLSFGSYLGAVVGILPAAYFIYDGLNGSIMIFSMMEVVFGALGTLFFIICAFMVHGSRKTKKEKMAAKEIAREEAKAMVQAEATKSNTETNQ